MSQSFAAPTATPPPRRSPWRTALVAVCLVLLALVAPLSIVSLWTHDEISDSSTYVATVAPLARDPAIQDALATPITEEITSRLGNAGVPVNDTVRGQITGQVRTAVATDAFGTAWDAANRSAHRQLMALLQDDDNVAQIRDDAVTLDLAPFIARVKQRLVASGLPLAANIPTVHAELTVLQVRHLSTVQRVYRTLYDLAYVLPVVGAVLLLLALALARNRRRTVLAAAVLVGASMLLLWLALVVARSVYLDAVSAQVTRATAQAFYDALVRFIRTSLLGVLAGCVVVAALALLAGPVLTAGRRRTSARPTT